MAVAVILDCAVDMVGVLRVVVADVLAGPIEPVDSIDVVLGEMLDVVLDEMLDEMLDEVLDEMLDEVLERVELELTAVDVLLDEVELGLMPMPSRPEWSFSYIVSRELPPQNSVWLLLHSMLQAPLLVRFVPGVIAFAHQHCRVTTISFSCLRL